APPRRASGWRQPPPSFLRPTTAVGAACRSEPRRGGNFAPQLANYLDNDPWPVPPLGRQAQPNPLSPHKVGSALRLRSTFGLGVPISAMVGTYRANPARRCGRFGASASLNKATINKATSL